MSIGLVFDSKPLAMFSIVRKMSLVSAVRSSLVIAFWSTFTVALPSRVLYTFKPRFTDAITTEARKSTRSSWMTTVSTFGMRFDSSADCVPRPIWVLLLL